MSEEEGGISTPDGQRPSVDDDLLEPKGKPKLIRVLTVVAYTLTVSMAAILLSIYYVFVWDGHPTLARKGPVASPLKGTNLEPLRFYADIFTSKNLTNFSLDSGNLTENENVLVDVPYEPTAIPVREATTPGAPDTEDEQDSWPEFQGNFTAETLEIKSPLIQKLIFKNALD